jgi:hypothetical protein
MKYSTKQMEKPYQSTNNFMTKVPKKTHKKVFKSNDISPLDGLINIVNNILTNREDIAQKNYAQQSLNKSIVPT